MNNALSLYINGPETLNNNISLATIGGTGNYFNLFIEVYSPTISVSTIDLSSIGRIDGITNYQQLTLPLFIKNNKINNFEFYLKVDDIGYYNNQKTLFTFGGYNSFSNYINFYLHNDSEYKNFNLIIKGSGISENFYPKDNYLNLYLCRDYEGIITITNLYINASQHFNNNIDLITHGNTIYTNSLNLFNASGIDVSNKLLNLYINGY